MYALPPEATEAEFRELLGYWQAKLLPGRLPGRQHIDPTEFPPRYLSQLLLLEVVEGAPPKPRRRYRFRVAGTAFTTIAGRDVTGLHYDEIGAAERTGPVIRAFDLVVERKAPVFLSGRLSLPSQEYVWVKRLGLPLAHDGHAVDMVLVVWLAERRQAAALDRGDPTRESGEPVVLGVR
ncbi:MAG: PAS domain-containing protein [Dongiaceae bacterium]